MTTRSSVWLGAISAIGIASCGGQFSTQSGTDGDAGVGGSRSGGATSTGGRISGGSTGKGGATAKGGTTGVGGSVGGSGGINPGTGGFYAGGFTGAGGTISSATEDEFRTSLISVYCDIFANCCASTVPFDHATCVANFTTIVAQNLTSPRAGYYTFDAAAAASCLTTISSTIGSDCASFPSSIACNGVYQGTLQPGEPCTADVECVQAPGDSISCDSGLTGNAICVRKHRVGEGQACAMNCTDNGGLLTCAGSGVSTPDMGRCYSNDELYCSAGFCVRMVDIGGLCGGSASVPCVSTAYCDATGICVPLGIAGDGCLSSGDCREDLHCSTANQHCEPDFPAGSPCSVSAECASSSCTNGGCSSGLGITVLCSILQGGIPTPVP